MLVYAIIIAGNGACTDIYLFTDLGIAKIGQVIGLGILAQHDVLGFNKIADLGVFLQHGTGPQAGVWAHFTVNANGSILQNTVGLDDGIVRDRTVDNHTIGSDLDVVTQRHLAFEHTVDIDAAVLANLQRTTNVDAVRINQRGTGNH